MRGSNKEAFVELGFIYPEMQLWLKNYLEKGICTPLQWHIDENVSSNMDVIGSDYCLPLLKGFEWEKWVFVAAKVVSR